MPSERTTIIRAIASAFVGEMIDDLVMDISQQAHKVAHRTTAVCEICKTKCCEVHVPASAAALSSSTTGSSKQTLAPPNSSQSEVPSRPVTPLSAAKANPSGATATPTSGGNKADVYLPCLNCNRPMASSRYASHLSQCLGLASARRSGVRTAAQALVKSKLGDTISRSNSPQVGAADDSVPGPSTGSAQTGPKPKGRPPKKDSTPKNQKKKGLNPPAPSNTPEINANNKRALSPRTTPSKNPKRSKHVLASASKGLPPPLSTSSAQSSSAKPSSRHHASPTSSQIDLSIASALSPTGSAYSNDGGTVTPSRSTSMSSMGGKFPPKPSTSGMKTVPGKSAPVGFVPRSIPAHNDADYVAIDGDDLVDTESSEDDSDND